MELQWPRSATFDIRHLTSFIRHLTFVIRHPTSVIRHFSRCSHGCGLFACSIRHVIGSTLARETSYQLAMSHNTTKFGSAKLKRSSHGGSFTDLAELYSEVSDIQKEHGKELIDELSIAKGRFFMYRS